MSDVLSSFFSFFFMNETAIYKMINGHLIHTLHTHKTRVEKKMFSPNKFSINIRKHFSSFHHIHTTTPLSKNAAEQTSCVPPLILRVCLAYYSISLHTFLCHTKKITQAKGEHKKKKKKRRDKFSNWWFCKFAVRLKRNEIKKLLFRFSVHVFLLLCCE